MIFDSVDRPISGERPLKVLCQDLDWDVFAQIQAPFSRIGLSKYLQKVQMCQELLQTVPGVNC